MSAELKVTEGRTNMIVPRGSVEDKVPPRSPAFFNPRARLSRDLSLIAYGTFLKNFDGPRIFLEGLAGIGARGLRVANELNVDRVAINDLNPSAIRLAEDSAKLNNITNVAFSEEEVCRFFSKHSARGKRGSIVDVDPFGSPVSFFDCCLRATMRGGILSCTATDLQVLNGLFQDACWRKYGGIPIRVQYGNEIAIRLILGCLGSVAGRLGMGIVPLFVESNMHYYRTYVKVAGANNGDLGFVLHCNACMHRRISQKQDPLCELCGSNVDVAGPLWAGGLFEKEFVLGMAQTAPELTVGEDCKKVLAKAVQEAGMPGTYYTLDEIAAHTKSSPPKLDSVINSLREDGFVSGPTAFSPTGFRTDATISEIEMVFTG